MAAGPTQRPISLGPSKPYTPGVSWGKSFGLRSEPMVITSNPTETDEKRAERILNLVIATWIIATFAGVLIGRSAIGWIAMIVAGLVTMHRISRELHKLLWRDP